MHARFWTGDRHRDQTRQHPKENLGETPWQIPSAAKGGGHTTQSGWLRQYFTPQHDEQCQHAVDMHTANTASPEGGASRRDFVKGGLVAGTAAGVAASGAIGGVQPAEAQAANPMGKDWWPSL